MRLALVIKYASARLVSVFYSRERRNFAVCVYVLIRLRRKTHLFSACVLGLIFYPASSQSRAHLPMLLQILILMVVDVGSRR